MLYFALVLGAAFLAGCTTAPPAALSATQMEYVLNNIEIPKSLVKMEKESLEIAEGDEQGDSYEASYNSSSTCEAVGSVDRVIYSSQWKNDNKQILPQELRGFTNRSGILFTLSSPESSDEYEYVTLYVTLLSFENPELAKEYQSFIGDNVEACGDLKGEVYSLALTKFQKVEDSQDFIINRVDSYDFALESFDISGSSQTLVGMWNLGSNIIAINGAVSENGSAEFGLDLQDLESGSEDVVAQIREIIKELPNDEGV